MFCFFFLEKKRKENRFEFSRVKKLDKQGSGTEPDALLYGTDTWHASKGKKIITVMGKKSNWLPLLRMGHRTSLLPTESLDESATVQDEGGPAPPWLCHGIWGDLGLPWHSPTAAPGVSGVNLPERRRIWPVILAASAQHRCSFQMSEAACHTASLQDQRLPDPLR